MTGLSCMLKSRAYSSTATCSHLKNASRSTSCERDTLNTGGVGTPERLIVRESISFRWCQFYDPRQASWKPSSKWRHTTKGFIIPKHSVHVPVLPSHRDALRSVLKHKTLFLIVLQQRADSEDEHLAKAHGRLWLASVVCDPNFSE